MRIRASLLIAVSIFVFGLFGSGTAHASDAVLIELFTSQGCSSCPPADQLLSAIGDGEGSADIIPLSFHVDYWNSIGWIDEFSSSRWSSRQRRYAASMQSNRDYTPQLVVQGELDCVGSNERCIRSAVERARSQGSGGTVTIARATERGGVAFVDANAALRAGRPGVVATVVVFESGLSTKVTRGENRGRTLRNDFVVRALREVGTIAAGDTSTRRVTTRIPVEDEWKRENLGVVLFLQEPKTRRVLAAVRAPLALESAELKPLPEAERVSQKQVALGGYCPVALVEAGRLVKGFPSLQYRYQGAIYQMTNPAAAAKFASQPARYVPPFATFDPVRYSENREKTTGSLNVFTLHQGRPWFFLNTDNKNKFLLGPDPYVQTALTR